MANDPDLADAAELTNALHATIDSLQDHIEARARELVHTDHAFVQAQRLGQSMRAHMIAKAPTREARDFLAGRPAETWTSSAAALLSQIYADIAKKEEEKRERRSEMPARPARQR